mmetsp:Transcript_87647/g.225813  ORF Transcript_87647/g.225813 Transcript_87647/m.225813 type:complete len:206 (-) Transcript_87647:456-1073(-)
MATWVMRCASLSWMRLRTFRRLTAPTSSIASRAASTPRSSTRCGRRTRSSRRRPESRRSTSSWRARRSTATLRPRFSRSSTSSMTKASPLALWLARAPCSSRRTSTSSSRAWSSGLTWIPSSAGTRCSTGPSRAVASTCPPTIRHVRQSGPLRLAGMAMSTILRARWSMSRSVRDAARSTRASLISACARTSPALARTRTGVLRG